MKEYISAYMEYLHDTDKLDNLVEVLNNWRKSGATKKEINRAKKIAEKQFLNVFEP